jgi:uncharacterized protein (TIGR03435 family)
MGSGDNAVRMKQSADGKSGVAQTAKNGAVKYSVGADGIIHYEYAKLDIPTLCDALSQFIGTPVVDMTELKGKYQIALDFSMADMMAVAKRNGVNIPAGAPGAGPANDAPDPGSSSVFGAVQRLGLKLESRKEPVEIIVLDKAEKMPTEN